MARLQRRGPRPRARVVRVARAAFRPLSDLGRRIATALIYGAAVLGALLLPPIVFIALLVAVGVLAIRELRSLLPQPPLVGDVVLGSAYIALGLGALAYLRMLGPQWVLVALVPTWAMDVASYVVGSRWGTRRIAPRISPGKTLEGTVGGVVAAAILGFATCAAAGVRPLAAFAIPALAGLVALAGDLLESAVKRAAGVKDSGTILPGHGGVLDRIDSLLLVAPFVALMSRLP